MRQVPLANGKGVALVDDEDYDRVSRHSWCLFVGGGKGCRAYAQANIMRDGRWRRTLLHRFITGAGEGERIDHRNNNGLDCRKENLRRATRGQNQHNSGPRGGSSRFKGVSWHAKAKKWQAQIMANRVRRSLGLFLSEEDAARAYDDAARELHGDFAWLNF